MARRMEIAFDPASLPAGARVLRCREIDQRWQRELLWAGDVRRRRSAHPVRPDPDASGR